MCLGGEPASCPFSPPPFPGAPSGARKGPGAAAGGSRGGAPGAGGNSSGTSVGLAGGRPPPSPPFPGPAPGMAMPGGGRPPCPRGAAPISSSGWELGGPRPTPGPPSPHPRCVPGGDDTGLVPRSARVPFASGRAAMSPRHQHLPGGSRGVSPQCPPKTLSRVPPPPPHRARPGPPRPAPGRGQRGLAGGAGKVAPVPALRPGGVTAGPRAATAPGSAPSLGSRRGGPGDASCRCWE